MRLPTALLSIVGALSGPALNEASVQALNGLLRESVAACDLSSADLARPLQDLDLDAAAVARTLNSIITEGEDTGPFKFEPAHLGADGELLLASYMRKNTKLSGAAGELARKIIVNYGFASAHFLTTAHLFHADHLLARLERKFQDCAAKVQRFDAGEGDVADLGCWTETMALATEARRTLQRPKPAFETTEFALADVTPRDLFYDTFTLELPYLCNSQREIFTTAHIDNYSPFINTLAEAFTAGKKELDAGLIWWATVSACLEGQERGYEGLLYAWARKRSPMLTPDVQSIFVESLQGKSRRASNSKDAVMAASNAVQMLSSLLGRPEAEGRTENFAAFIASNAERILENPDVFMLWLALDGASWRAKTTRKQIALLQILQCFAFDEGQAFDVGAEGLIAGGAMWCSKNPAKLQLGLKQQASAENVVLSTSIDQMLEDFQTRGVKFDQLHQIN